MRRPPASTVYSIDAGGSRTVVSLSLPGEPKVTWVRESFAIASTGETSARATLRSLLDELRARTAHAPRAVGCIASSSMPVGEEAPAPRLLIDVIADHAPAGRVVIVNDVIPPLWAAPLGGVGVVVCSGTGSSVIGRGADNRTVKVGGHEHIVSDQGSAYSLAREALRAAARDVDGTGPTTKLRAAAEGFFGRPLPALGRWLAELPRPRTTVANFAPLVIAGAEDDDAVASAIVEHEAMALASATEVAARRLALSSMPPIAFAGGVLRGSTYFRELVERQLAVRALTDDTRTNLHLIDGGSAGAQFAMRLIDVDGAPGESRVPDGIVLDVAS